ncbi:UNVERIFIED_CONTAM: hypothetical protein Sangu_1749200 [Sesamum angustifolium]|uniref:Phytocyanin domain-containing protein n=1 Tax=Sesamum angustifolium TaxID=2727405 RepID=A0AAW2M8N2_9LAMI
MGNSQLWCTLLLLLAIQGEVLCNVYQVGDLHAWGIPTSSNPQIYTKWSKSHNLNIGDSLFFLYPPSEDSVIQVTSESYNSCNLKDPILYMNNGNSLFNITKPGDLYFTSGVDGRCQKSQKLHVSVYGNGSYVADSPAYGPAASAPSYPTVFGSIPMQAASASASASPLLRIPVFVSAVAGIFCIIAVIAM